MKRITKVTTRRRITVNAQLNRFILIILLHFAILSSYAQYTQIPDDNFEAALAAYDDELGDNQIPTQEIENIDKLDISNLEIDNLSGIEDFISLEELNCSGNNLTSLDVSDISTLAILRCNDNALTTLDLGSINTLEELYCQNNQLSSIDITSATDIGFLYCSNNSLSSIDFSETDFLEVIDCSENDISSLNTENLGDLEELYCQNNNLTSIDLQFNPNLNTVNAAENSIQSFNGENLELLETLTLSDNPLDDIDLSELIALKELLLVTSNLTSLDVSKNTALTDIQVTSHNIESLDFRNNTFLKLLVVVSPVTKYINVQNGTNENIEVHAIYGATDLCVAVDDETYSKTYWGNAQSTDIYTENFCRYTQIPDANFESALSTYDDNSGDGQVPTINIESLTSLSLNERGITDTTGIEDFAALTSLYLRENNFTTIDLSNNTLLETIDLNETGSLESVNLTGLSLLKSLNLGSTSLISLDIEDSPLLESLSVGVTELTDLDITNAPLLEYLGISSTPISALDISNNPLLEAIYINDTNIESLDASHCNNLTQFSAVFSDALTFLNVQNGNNTNVTRFDVRNTDSLTCILVDDASASYLSSWSKESYANFSDTYCRYTQIPDINFEAALGVLMYDDASGDGQVPTALIENITSLSLNEKGITDPTGIEDFVSLTHLSLRENSFTTIDLSNNVLLEEIDFNEVAPLETINLTGLSKLTYLDLNQTNISEVDISDAVLLEFADLSTSNLSSLDVTNNTLLDDLDVAWTNLSALDLSKCVNLTEFGAYNANLYSLNIKNGNNSNINSFDVRNNPNLTCIQVDNSAYSTSNWTNKDNSATFGIDCESLSVSLSVILEAAFDADDFGFTPMFANIREIIPTTSPYNARETCDSSVFETTGDGAVVDWVEVQLRNADDINEIVSSKSALLLRNGNIVDVDGVSGLIMTAWEGTYYVAIAHRNHLTIVSDTTYELELFQGTNIDFRNPENVVGGTNALTDLGNNSYGMPLGDADGNGQIQNSDASTTIFQIGISGYNAYDVDMNGQVQNSDVNTILQNLGKGEQF